MCREQRRQTDSAEAWRSRFFIDQYVDLVSRVPWMQLVMEDADLATDFRPKQSL
jgi:hypothetical protein